MMKSRSQKLSVRKETLRLLGDAQLGAIVGGLVYLPKPTGGCPIKPLPPSQTCMTLCGCPNTNLPPETWFR